MSMVGLWTKLCGTMRRVHWWLFSVTCLGCGIVGRDALMPHAADRAGMWSATFFGFLWYTLALLLFWLQLVLWSTGPVESRRMSGTKAATLALVAGFGLLVLTCASAPND